MPDRFRDAKTSTETLVPRYYVGTDDDLVVERITGFFDDELLRLDDLLDELKGIKDPAHATNRQLSLLYAERGFEPPLMISETRRRSLFFRLPGFILRKGDPKTVRDVINAMTSLGVESVAFWSDPKFWYFGKKKFGIGTRIGIFYKAPGLLDWRFGQSPFGIRTKIGDGYTNQRLAYTVQLRLPRPPSSAELAAIRWAVRYFGRAEDHYDIFYPPTSVCWIISTSKIGIDTKICASCWVFGKSKFGKTTVICTPDPVIPSPIVGPTSPGTWVPFAGSGGGVYYPSPPVWPPP